MVKIVHGLILRENEQKKEEKSHPEAVSFPKPHLKSLLHLLPTPFLPFCLYMLLDVSKYK
jgi:hypothetical protein